MNAPTAGRSRLDRRSRQAFSMAVLAAYGSPLGNARRYPAWDLTALVVLGVAFTALGLWGRTLHLYLPRHLT